MPLTDEDLKKIGSFVSGEVAKGIGALEHKPDRPADTSVPPRGNFSGTGAPAPGAFAPVQDRPPFKSATETQQANQEYMPQVNPGYAQQATPEYMPQANQGSALTQDDMRMLGSFISAEVAKGLSGLERDTAATAGKDRASIVGIPEVPFDAGPKYYIHLANSDVIESHDSSSTHMPDKSGTTQVVIGRYPMGEVAS